jgi:hypothetical protein
MTDLLETAEAEFLRQACAEPVGRVDRDGLSEDGRAVYPLLTTLDADAAEAALKRLPRAMQDRLDAMSPVNYLDDFRAPLLVILHDRGDVVIPVAESRRLQAALIGRAGVRYTELGFQHLNPYGVSPFRLARELATFYLAVYPLFRQAVAS